MGFVTLYTPQLFTHLRWLAAEGIKIASEKRQRALSKELITVDIQAEVSPFTFSLKNGGEEVRASAIAYIPYLQDKIFELLDQYSRYGPMGLVLLSMA